MFLVTDQLGLINMLYEITDISMIFFEDMLNYSLGKFKPVLVSSNNKKK